jgi:hypothetical protein
MTKYLKLTAVLLTVPFVAILFVNLWPVGAQTALAQTKVETAGEKFKNIKVLNEMPADQLGRVMNIVAASLGNDAGLIGAAALAAEGVGG